MRCSDDGTNSEVNREKDRTGEERRGKKKILCKDDIVLLFHETASDQLCHISIVI